MLEIYITDINDIETFYDDALRLVTASRRERADRFIRRDDRLRCAAAGLLLRRFLGVADDGMIKYNEYGKPELKSGRHFSLSHSGQYTVLAVSDMPVGVDIERIYDVKPGVMRKVCTPEEFDWASLEPKNFFTIWTRKESVVKAIGKGFHIAPSSFSVLPADGGTSCTADGSQWFLNTAEYMGYMLSAASPEPIAELNVKYADLSALLS